MNRFFNYFVSICSTYLGLCNGLIRFLYPCSARIWTIHDHDDRKEVVGPVLFGHSARIWDCCISDHVRFM